jgi:hypothetical protein
VTWIGQVTEGEGLTLTRSGRPLELSGYEH